MNNKIIISSVAVFLIMSGVFLFTNNQSQQGRQMTQQPDKQQPSTQKSITQPNAIENKSITINIQNFAYDPPTITVKQGTTVTWINNDSVIHDVKSDTFASQALKRGDKFEYTFDKKSTFEYLCTYHPAMTGKIIVE